MYKLCTYVYFTFMVFFRVLSIRNSKVTMKPTKNIDLALL